MAKNIADVYRGDLIESYHLGDIAVVNAQNEIVSELGDGSKITYWRSAAKPIQALPILTSGAAEKYNLTDKEIAVMCASHSGEEEHVEVVQGILDKIGLDQSALLCGTHRPFSKKSANYLCESGDKPTELYNNCSGKHAGLLTLCQFNNWSIDDYYKLEHPLQSLILDKISEITGYSREKIYTGEDGCGVVVFGLPLKNMAYAFARLANPQSLPLKYREAAERITSSMEKYPKFVGGSERFNTKLLYVVDRTMVAKSGAQGVFCIGVHEKDIGIAVKVADGSSRGVKPATMETLKQMDLVTDRVLDKLKEYHYPPVENHRGHKVGKIVPDFKLRHRKK
jgi:L-asparaginase II